MIARHCHNKIARQVARNKFHSMAALQMAKLSAIKEPIGSHLVRKHNTLKLVLYIFIVKRLLQSPFPMTSHYIARMHRRRHSKTD
jgi:hypothetical protein